MASVDGVVAGTIVGTLNLALLIVGLTQICSEKECLGAKQQKIPKKIRRIFSVATFVCILQCIDVIVFKYSGIILHKQISNLHAFFFCLCLPVCPFVCEFA